MVAHSLVGAALIVTNAAKPNITFKIIVDAHEFMKIPYRQQITTASCGAAVIEMVLKHCGITRMQKEIIQILQFDDSGATNTSLVRVLTSFGIHCIVYAQQSQEKEDHIRVLSEKALVHLLGYLDDGQLVILNYLAENGEGHYVLAHAHNKDHLIVHDPDPYRGGPNVVLKKKYFEERWISGDSKWQKWFAVVDIPEGLKKWARPDLNR